MKKLLLGVAILMAMVGGAHAQTNSGVVVSSCGTPPVTYTAGQAYPLTQDTNGYQCTSQNGSSGGTVTANQGTPNAGTTNSWWVQLYNALVGQGSTTSGQSGMLGMMATLTAPPTDTTAQTNALRGDTHGGLRTVPQDTHGTVSDFTLPTLVIPTSQYPNGSSVITGNATGTTGAVVGTLAGTSGKTTFICGFDVSVIGGTAAVGPITIAGLTGSSMVYQFSSLAAGNTLSRSFPLCVPASATNTAITITTTADGTATAVDVNSWGYQL